MLNVNLGTFMSLTKCIFISFNRLPLLKNKMEEYAMSRRLSSTMVARDELAPPDKKNMRQKMREVYIKSQSRKQM